MSVSHEDEPWPLLHQYNQGSIPTTQSNRIRVGSCLEPCPALFSTTRSLPILFANARLLLAIRYRMSQFSNIAWLRGKQERLQPVCIERYVALLQITCSDKLSHSDTKHYLNPNASAKASTSSFCTLEPGRVGPRSCSRGMYTFLPGEQTPHQH